MLTGKSCTKVKEKQLFMPAYQIISPPLSSRFDTSVQRFAVQPLQNASVVTAVWVTIRERH